MLRSLGLLALLASFGCGAGQVRVLTQSEEDYLKALKTSVTENQPKLQRALDDIGLIHENAAVTERKQRLDGIAKEKLLESLKSPWTTPPTNMQATQRAVVLSHLYDLAQTEQQAFEAAQAERASARTQIASRWERIGKLLGDALTNQEKILKDLNQPTDQQVENVLSNFLLETKAFQGELAKSDDPELKRLAADTEKALGKVDGAKSKLESVLQLLDPSHAAPTPVPAPAVGAATGKRP